jgi:hypothetical protein
MKIILGIILILLIGLLFSACGQATAQPVSTETATPSPTFTRPLAPSQTLAQTPTPTLDPTMQMWATAAESLNQARHTSIAATEQAHQSFLAQFPSRCGDNAHYSGGSFSPNGYWSASACWYGEFQIINRDASVEWIIPYSSLYPPPANPKMLGDVIPLYWTEDSAYLYFTTSYCCVDTDSVSQAESLYRLDLRTGDWLRMISGYFNYYSFSPTGQRLIHIPDEQVNGKSAIINIIDLDTDNNTYITLNGYEQAAWVYWRGDGKAFAITAKNGGVYSTGVEEFAIDLVDIETKSVKLIISNLNNAAEVTNWSADGMLTIQITKYIEPFGSVPEYLYYNSISNEFITSTPTP